MKLRVQVKRYQVVGDPVAHSLSPRIHAAFAEQTGVAMEYRAARVSAGTLHSYLDALPDTVHGLNVTVPLKREAFDHCAHCSGAARRARAVNTLLRCQAGWRGENTDGSGLVCDLEGDSSLGLSGRHVVIFGAGGAVCGILGALVDAGVSRISIVNRTRTTAQRLAEWFGSNVIGLGLEQIDELAHHSLLINATSAGWSGAAIQFPKALFNGVEQAYDLSYGNAAAAFLARAREAGVPRCADGRGMLLQQAALSFVLWHGVLPDTNPVRRRLDQWLAHSAS